MWAVFSSLLGAVGGAFRRRRDLEAELLALRHQVLVLNRKRGRHRVRLRPADRVFWVSQSTVHRPSFDAATGRARPRSITTASPARFASASTTPRARWLPNCRGFSSTRRLGPVRCIALLGSDLAGSHIRPELGDCFQRSGEKSLRSEVDPLPVPLKTSKVRDTFLNHENKGFF